MKCECVGGSKWGARDGSPPPSPTNFRNFNVVLTKILRNKGFMDQTKGLAPPGKSCIRNCEQYLYKKNPLIYYHSEISEICMQSFRDINLYAVADPG